MFIGHYGLAFAAKKISAKPSLGTNFLAAQLLDLLWPVFLLFGLERVAIEPGNTAFTPLNFVSYPFSHSLLAVVMWGLLSGLVYYLAKNNEKSALLVTGLVLSHWFLDMISHAPDLPLDFYEETKVGLGLWNNKLASLAVEGLIFFGGLTLYVSETKSRNKAGTYGLVGLVAFLLIIYTLSALGNPPPDSRSVMYAGLAQWVFIFWGYWVDQNRTLKETGLASGSIMK